MDENKIVLCGANAYEKKYYFNEEQFKMIPDSIKQELHVICVLSPRKWAVSLPLPLRRMEMWSWRPMRMMMTSIMMRSLPDC